MKLTTKPKKVRVWNKGQITIPKSIRENFDIDDDTILNMVQIGNAIFLTPRDLKLPKLAREFQAIMKKENITENDLMQALKQARKEVYKERYARKKKKN